MTIRDLLMISAKSFKNRKSRVALTVLGMAVAIGVILFLVSLGYGLQRTILERITTSDSLLTLDVFPPDTESISLTQSSVEDIQQLDAVAITSPQAVLTARAHMDELASELKVNVVDEYFFTLAGLSGLDTTLTVEEQDSVVISPVVAELFAVPIDEILGKTLVLNFSLIQEEDESASTVSAALRQSITTIERQFIVSGIVASLDQVPEVYVHQKNLTAVPIQEYQAIKVQVTEQEELEGVRTALIERGYLVSALSDLVAQANQVFGIIQTILAIFGIFSLVVAAIGLINTMTISLLERTNEIGIMRAIGASSWNIRIIFLVESTIIGFLGGVIGIVIGVIGGGIFTLILNVLARSLGAEQVQIFYTPAWFIVFVVFFSACVGCVSGVIPAIKAGRLNALTALRYK